MFVYFMRPTGMTKLRVALGGMAAAAFLAGCAHEKSTDYRRADFTSRHTLRSHYHGDQELRDLDVLGMNAGEPTDETIRKTLDKSSKVDLKPGESILVLQSGEPIPDARMVSELNERYRAIPFSGIRSDWQAADTDAPDRYAKALRFAAAQAGAEKILCFWGSLEIARQDLSTKTVSWIPVLDFFVPDQKDSVRVHLKMALVDVRSGEWAVFRSAPIEEEVVSTAWEREHLENSQVKRMKLASYKTAVSSLTGAKQ